MPNTKMFNITPLFEDVGAYFDILLRPPETLNVKVYEEKNIIF